MINHRTTPLEAAPQSLLREICASLKEELARTEEELKKWKSRAVASEGELRRIKELEFRKKSRGL